MGRAVAFTVPYVTPSDYAAPEFALWEQALREQREAEKELNQARRKLRFARVLELAPEVQALRTTSDLLLAHAVNVKCTFRDGFGGQIWASSTQPGCLEPVGT